MNLNSGKNEDLLGELVGNLGAAFNKKLGRILDVSASNQINAKSGKTTKIISLAPNSGPNSTFVKNKDGTVTFS